MKSLNKIEISEEEMEEVFEWLNEINPDWTKKEYPSKYYKNNLLAERYNSELIYKDSMRPIYKPGIKEIEPYDLNYSFMKHFINLKDKYANNFEMYIKDNLSTEQYNLYKNMINDWSDGKRRNSTLIKNLKKSIYNYLKYNGIGIYCSKEEENCIVRRNPDSIDLLTPYSLRLIILKQADLIESLLDEVQYKEGINTFGDMSIKYLDIHRGLNLNNLEYFRETSNSNFIYCEKNILNSYSISINVAEKFSLIKNNIADKNDYKIILSSSYNHFYKNVIASSFLNESLNINQFELLTFPPQKVCLNFEGLNDGMYDYRLDPESIKYLN